MLLWGLLAVTVTRDLTGGLRGWFRVALVLGAMWCLLSVTFMGRLLTIDWRQVRSGSVTFSWLWAPVFGFLWLGAVLGIPGAMVFWLVVLVNLLRR